MERRDNVDRDHEMRAIALSFLLTDRIEDTTVRMDVEYASRSVNISLMAGPAYNTYSN